MLDHKAQELIAKNKELREFYERTTEHRNGLQNTEKELEKLENALLRVKFPREAKDCSGWLAKSQKQLQTCRKKMSECTCELTINHTDNYRNVKISLQNVKRVWKSAETSWTTVTHKLHNALKN